MPQSPPRACRCGLVVQAGQRCPRCTRQTQRFSDNRRGSFRERGYSSDWDKLRALYVNEHPLCERCDAAGRITPTVLVHHKRPVSQGGAMLDWDNLFACCTPCHGALHAELARGRRPEGASSLQ